MSANATGVIRDPKADPKTGPRPWTTREIADLRRLAGHRASDVAVILGRSVDSVKLAARRHGISLRPPGERRGRVLGVPPEIATLAGRIQGLEQIRQDVQDGTVDVSRMLNLIRLVTAGAPMCPACGLRPQEVKATGLCLNCHARQLAWSHAHDDDRAAARRQLDSERQRKHRRRAAGRKEATA